MSIDSEIEAERRRPKTAADLRTAEAVARFERAVGSGEIDGDVAGLPPDGLRPRPPAIETFTGGVAALLAAKLAARHRNTPS